MVTLILNHSYHTLNHGLLTPGEEIAFTARPKIAFTARPKIKSQSQTYRYGRSIFCLPHRPKISCFFDLCLQWVFVVRALNQGPLKQMDGTVSKY